MSESGSREVARAAIEMALSATREEERRLKENFSRQEIRAAAVDYGGEYLAAVKSIVERAVVAAKREGLIHESHAEEGAVAGATREALSQIMPKAFGLNVGGKVGLARRGDHVAVAVFFGIGLLHLDEVAVGLGHRAIG
ncbi:MAG: hut operon positive regulator HutP [Firmicutes bacterium]|nr:hut operon positive regulator HutP [Bacillota bacterium]